MKKVFVGGSRKISRLNEQVRKRLDQIIEKQLQVLLGDANGADKADDLYRSGATMSAITEVLLGSGASNGIRICVYSNEDENMKKVFVGGSRKISRLSLSSS
jgi:hypothetical protein